MNVQKNECPFCGTKNIDKEKFVDRTGIEIEKTYKWNGETKLILRLGEIVLDSQRRNGQDTIDKQKIIEMFRQEQDRLNEQRKDLEENRVNIAKEQKSNLDVIALQRKELEEKKNDIEREKETLQNLRAEVIKEEGVKIPKELMKKMKELSDAGINSNAKVLELLNKMLHNAKVSGTFEETQLLRRLKSLNTGDRIEHMGGPNVEDVLITVIDNGKELGKIKFDSKKVEKWDNKFVDKMERYLKEDKVDFGVITSSVLPKNAAGSDFYWEKDNTLICDLDSSEVVYLVLRYLVIKHNQYKCEYERKSSMLRDSQNKFEAVKQILENSSIKNHLNKIIQIIGKDNENIDALENYVKNKTKAFRSSNLKINEQVNFALDSNNHLQAALEQ